MDCILYRMEGDITRCMIEWNDIPSEVIHIDVAESYNGYSRTTKVNGTEIQSDGQVARAV